MIEHGTVNSYINKNCRCSDCKQAWRLYYSERGYKSKHNAKHKRLIDEIKTAYGCVDCGYNEHPEALEFDHINGDKLFSIGQSKARSWSKTQAEMLKCEIVCANCHRIRTFLRRQSV